MSARRAVLGLRGAADLLVGLGALLGPATAWAATCALTVTPVAFGNYNALSSANVDSAGNVAVNCDVATPYTVALSPGHGTLLVRQMLGGSWTMSYNLYTDSLRSVIWGDGTSGTSLVSGNATSANFTVYGRIPGAQPVGAGSYSDVVTVTLTY